MKLVFSTFRSQDTKALAGDITSSTELEKNVGACAKLLFGNFTILIDVIHHIAKKLAEASRLSGWSAI